MLLALVEKGSSRTKLQYESLVETPIWVRTNLIPKWACGENNILIFQFNMQTLYVVVFISYNNTSRKDVLKHQTTLQELGLVPSTWPSGYQVGTQMGLSTKLSYCSLVLQDSFSTSARNIRRYKPAQTFSCTWQDLGFITLP